MTVGTEHIAPCQQLLKGFNTNNAFIFLYTIDQPFSHNMQGDTTPKNFIIKYITRS